MARHSPSPVALRNQRGAVDLPSIMVGAIVLGLLTASILATVFTVIPWAQDNAAKQKVGQIVQAQTTYYAFTSTDHASSASSAGPRYGHLHSLEHQSLLAGIEPDGSAPDTSSGVSNSVDDKIRMEVFNTTAGMGGGEDTFQVWVRSDTGKVFTANNSDPQPSGANLLAAAQQQPFTQSTYATYSSVWQDLQGLEGQQVTVSFDMRVGIPREVWVYGYQATGLSIERQGGSPEKFQATGDWQRFSFTSTVKRWDGTTEDVADINIRNPGWLIYYDPTRDTNQSIRVRDIKIEHGDQATSYSPTQGTVPARW